MPVIGVSIAIPEPWGCELQRARLSYGDEQALGVAECLDRVDGRGRQIELLRAHPFAREGFASILPTKDSAHRATSFSRT